MSGKMVGVFVDVSNLYYCIGKRFEGRKLDYAKYLHGVVPDGDSCFTAIAYGMQVDSEATKFITCLKHIGFEAKYKKPRINKGFEVRRMSWNVGIATDVVRLINKNKLDTVVIGSADSELSDLVSWIRESGVQCNVVACGITKELKEVCDNSQEISEDFLEIKS